MNDNASNPIVEGKTSSINKEGKGRGERGRGEGERMKRMLHVKSPKKGVGRDGWYSFAFA